jgi:hypothetical protein
MSRTRAVGASLGAGRSRANLIEQAVAFDMAYVLAGVASARHRDVATALHSRLHATWVDSQSEFGFGDSSIDVESTREVDTLATARVAVIAEINACTASILTGTARDMSAIQASDVLYRLEVLINPDRGVDEFIWKFDEVPSLVDPALALASMEQIRSDSSQLQRLVFRLLCALNSRVNAEHSVSLALDDGDERLQARREDLRRVERQIVALQGRLPDHLQRLAVDVKEGFQFGSNEPFPFCYQLLATSSDEDLVSAAGALESLAPELRAPFAWQVIGDRAAVNQVRRWWASCAVASVKFRVIAAWLRGITAATDHPRCDICYRHRATSKRCTLHHTKGSGPMATGSESREALFGRQITPHYLARARTLVERTSVRKALKRTLLFEHGEVAAAMLEAAAQDVPDRCLREVALLACQLRRLRAVAGCVEQEAMSALFGDVLKCVRAFFGSEISEVPVAIRDSAFAGDYVLRLITLRGFLRLWWGATQAPEILRRHVPQALGGDPRNPALRGALVDIRLKMDLIHQRAWDGAESEFVARTSITQDQVRKLLKTMSLRAAAKELGCSHEKVRKVLLAEGGQAPLRRRSFRTYVQP